MGHPKTRSARENRWTTAPVPRRPWGRETTSLAAGRPTIARLATSSAPLPPPVATRRGSPPAAATTQMALLSLALGDEGNLAAIERRPAREPVEGRVRGELPRRAAARGHHPDVPIPAPIRVERDLASVRRPSWIPVGCRVRRQRRHLSAGGRQHPEVLVPAPVRADRQLPAVGRHVDELDVRAFRDHLHRVGPGGGPVRENGNAPDVGHPASHRVRQLGSVRRKGRGANAEARRHRDRIADRRAILGHGLLPEVHAPAAIRGVIDLASVVRPARAPDVGHPVGEGDGLVPDASTVQSRLSSGLPPPASR